MLLKTKYNNNKKKKKIFYRIRCCVYIGIPGRIQKKNNLGTYATTTTNKLQQKTDSCFYLYV